MKKRLKYYQQRLEGLTVVVKKLDAYNLGYFKRDREVRPATPAEMANMRRLIKLNCTMVKRREREERLTR